MALPDIGEFNAFLDGLSLTQPKDSGKYCAIEVVPARTLSDRSQVWSIEPIRLWCPLDTTLGVERFLEKLAKEIQATGHPSSPSIAKSVLAIWCALQRRDGTAVQRLNRVLSSVGTCDSSQFVISRFPPHPGTRSYRIGRFTVGPLDRKKLVYRCERAGCDFFKRYPHEFLDRFAVEADPGPVGLVDWSRLHRWADLPAGLKSEGDTVIDAYFDQVAQCLRDEFVRQFWDAQEVVVAAGAPFLDLASDWWGQTFVAVFHRVGSGGTGYFCPVWNGISVDYADADRRVPQIAEQLKREFAFEGLGKSEIHRTIKTFTRVISKARVHEASGRRDEAFLHFMIALDLLFGEQDKSTRSVAERCALVVHRPLGWSLKDGAVAMRDLYDVRSKYVHEGRAVDEKHLGAIQPVVLEVLWCLLRLQATEENRVDGQVRRWLKALDYLLAAGEAGKALPEAELLAHGIALSGKGSRSQ